MTIRRRRHLYLAAALCLAGVVVACADNTGTLGSVRVYGLMLRGPTQPVCAANDPCDEPFAAGFTVFQGSRDVRRFRSGSDGRFAIRLDPGDYTVVPDSDAPILGRQPKDLQVAVADSIFVTFDFDTGIR